MYLKNILSEDIGSGPCLKHELKNVIHSYQEKKELSHVISEVKVNFIFKSLYYKMMKNEANNSVGTESIFPNNLM